MTCLVCTATWDDRANRMICPQCGYDHKDPAARDPQRVQMARQSFRERTTAYAPDKRVTGWDRFKPWLAILLGIALFVGWLKACSMWHPW
jgi:hypothetical protein